MSDRPEYGGSVNNNVAAKYANQLSRLKDNVHRTFEYFRSNYERFHEYRKFVFKTSLTNDDMQLNRALQRPTLEFNINEAYISRLRGEFSKQEPSISVMAEYGQQVDPAIIEVVEGHIRHLLSEANKNSFEYNVYTDLLSGGFSVIKVRTDYAHPMSFDQVIKFDRVYEPTLCGFDPMARLPHKGDANYCFENYPKTKADFEAEFPKINIKDLKFSRDIEGFSWSYKVDQEDILVVCEYYEKKRKRKQIVKLADGKVLSIDEYKKMIETWDKIEQPPAIVGKPRWTEVETICRYRFIENQVLDYIETDFKMLPLIFVDGNSIMIRDSLSGAFVQTTRPYIYHAKDTQRLKNYAGMCLANELENMVMHKWKVAKESIPLEEDYLEAYKDPQHASILVYNAYIDGEPDKQVPPPQEIVRAPIPPEITNTFQLSDQLMQTILGSYDASLGINENQLSGIAIVEGATQSNAAAMPYVVGFLQALNQLANIILDLIPKYYVTPRTIPIVGMDGKKSFVEINQNPQQGMQGQQPQAQQQQQQQPIELKYDENALQVKVEAGVNFQIQKNKALQQIIALTQASPLFAQFMAQEGLDVLLDNVEIRGIDVIKQKADAWMVQMKQQQAQQAQMQQQMMQNNPQMIKAKAEAQKVQVDAMLGQAELENKMRDSHLQNAATQMKAQAEIIKALSELQMKRVDMAHSHEMDRHDKYLKAHEIKIKGAKSNGEG